MSSTDPARPGGADASMDDILASIRRILNEDEAAVPAGAPAAAAPPARNAPPPRDDVLMLDPAMMIPDPPPPTAVPARPAPPAVAAPAPAPSQLVAPEAAAAAAGSVSALVRTLTADRGTTVTRNGPSLEDLVRDELRPVLKAWLDQHLPPLVERLVRAEIERVVSRAGP